MFNFTVIVSKYSILNHSAPNTKHSDFLSNIFVHNLTIFSLIIIIISQ
jgi:hypothetical protein